MYILLLLLLLFSPPVFGQTFNAAYIEKANVWTALQTFNGTTAGDVAGPTWAGLATSYHANRFVVNSYPLAAEFPGVVVEAFTGAVDVPASADFTTHSAGIAGYGRTSSTSVGGVGIFGMGSTHLAGATAWGGNVVAANEGLAAANLFGLEVDVNHTDTTAAAVNVSGVAVTGASDAQASGTFVAFLANPAGIFEVPMIGWKSAFYSVSGAATAGLSLYTQDRTGASASQFIEIYGRDAGDAYHGAIIQTLTNGEFDIRAADAGGIKITSSAAAPWMTFSATGEVSIAAVSGSGKIVCVQASGDLGVCSNDPAGGTGTCTCG